MSKQSIGLGSSANDGTGDTARAAGAKINENFDELYAALGDGTDLEAGLTAFTTTQETKLTGIEDSATADQTGAEIETALDTELANVRWKVEEVPSGGATGQVLKKVDNTDYNYSWQNDSGAGGGISDIVEDTTPQLGGNLDLNGNTVGAASAADLTKLSEITATSVELNYVDGVTSDIQDQIDNHTHTTTDITDFAESLQDAVAAMFASGTQTDITVTYDDTDGTLDLAVSDPSYVNVAASSDTTTAMSGNTVRSTGGSATTLTVVSDTITRATTLVQTGAGALTVAAGGGVTINPQPGGTLISAGQYAILALVPVGTNAYVLTGATTTA